MSLLSSLFRRKPVETVFDPKPKETSEMPVRPYRVLHAGLPFYSDPECACEVLGARLVVLRSEDPRQQHHPIECMPTRKHYEKDQVLSWDINHKIQWEDAWYVNPESGNKEKAWVRAVEFIGMVVKL